MEATEMCHHWECRRKEEFCKWRDAQRKKQVGRGALYKEELAGPRSPGSLALAWVCSDFKGWRTKKTKTGPLHSSEKHSEPSVWISQAKISDRRANFQSFKVIKNTAHPSLSASRHRHIGATVHHGDQHGHAACPFAAFGDGGVPPVSGYSLCLQGRAPRAPPPLRTVWHHWGGGGGLLQSGGGPGPEVVLADRGEPEEEHQMSPFIIWARARWIRLGCSRSGDQRTPSLSWMQTDEAVPDSKNWACVDLTEEKHSWLTNCGRLVEQKDAGFICNFSLFCILCFSVIGNIQVFVFF